MNSCSLPLGNHGKICISSDTLGLEENLRIGWPGIWREKKAEKLGERMSASDGICCVAVEVYFPGKLLTRRVWGVCRVNASRPHAVKVTFGSFGHWFRPNYLHQGAWISTIRPSLRECWEMFEMSSTISNSSYDVKIVGHGRWSKFNAARPCVEKYHG